MNAAGQPLARMVSLSLRTPQTLTGYSEFFRQNSTREDGWIMLKVGDDKTWQNKWFIFEDGVLKYGASATVPDSALTSVPMDQVISLKTDNVNKSTIVITTPNSKLYLKLASTDEMRKWLFAFQKSVALVLTHLMNSAEQQNDTGRNKHTSGKMGAPSPEKFGVGKRSPLNTSHGNIEHLGCVDRNHSPNAGDFRHSDGVENTVSRPFGSSAIPIQVPQQKSSHHGHGHHRSQQQAHSHHAHSHHVHSHHAHSHHSSSRSKSGLGCPSGDGTVAMPAGTSYGYGGTGRGESVDKLATSFKEEDATHLRLEELLHTPSTEESRSRAHSGDSDSNNSSDEEDADGDWRSKSSNEMQNDDEDEMMFDLDETAESRNSMVSDTPRTHSHSSSSTATTGGRNLSSESTGPFGGGGGGGGADSFYSFGKALTVSMTLSDPDHKSPSRRSSHAGLPAPLPPPPALVHGSSHSSHSSVGSPNANGSSSSTAAPPSSVGGVKNPAGACSAAYAQLSLANHSEYLMWESGFCSKAGIRDSQEDRFSCHPNINDQVRCAALGVPSSSGALSGDSAGATTSSSGLGGGVEEAGGYFGVYDGHGGQAAAIYLEKYLLGNICVHPQFGKNLNQAVVESCIRTDNDFLVECDAKKIYCGTTALGAFVIGSELLVFSIGDCQAVLSSRGQAVELNDPHKPGRKDETERIQRAGGWITEEKELYMYRLHRMDLSDPLVVDKAKQVSWTTINRVCGEISVSRSIGDPDYKRFTPGEVTHSAFSWPEQHDQVFHADLLIPDPECRAHRLVPGDEFLVLASDGLWDVVTPAEAVKLIGEAFAQNKSPSEAAEELCELAIKLGSSDNVTIVITRFMHSVVQN